METFLQALLATIVGGIVVGVVLLILEHRTTWFARADSPIKWQNVLGCVLRRLLKLLRAIAFVGIIAALLVAIASSAQIQFLRNAINTENRVLLLTIALAGAIWLGIDQLSGVRERVGKQEAELANIAEQQSDRERFSVGHESQHAEFYRLAASQPIEVFDELFRGNLTSWDFEGQWHVDNQVLTVGPADRGGIIKHGLSWRDYTVTIVARIVARNLGIIIRARDPQNYYMLQIAGCGLVCPHRRQVPYGSDEGSPWRVFSNLNSPHNVQTGQWFTATVRVVGQSVTLFLNGEEVFYRDNWLETEAGSVGLRCSPGTDTPEQAEIASVKVVLYQ